MADVSTTVGAPWSDGAGVALAIELPWDDATAVASVGGAWTPPPAPPGGTVTGPTTDADYLIPRRTVYDVVHTVTVVDQRDAAAVELYSMSLSCDEASICWTLSATGPEALFERLTTGADMPVLDIVIDGMQWLFLVESVQRSREFGNSSVRITGRSLTIAAGEPYQYAQNWVNDGPTTAAQIAEQAQVYTGLEIEWQLDDWPVPDRVWTFTGSPLAVVQRVAESVRAVLRSSRAENRLAVMPRYRLLPNEWPETAPDVEIHIEAATTDSFDRADRPAYNGIYVSGQQQGVTCFVRLAGTSGDKAAPLVTDLLITDTVAGQQRGAADLGSGGPQATIQMTLPVLIDGTAPGVLELGWLCRVIDGFSKWWGVVRAVTLNVAFPSVMQTVTLERHLGFIGGTAALEEEVPAVPPPPTGPSVGWSDPIHTNGGFVHSNSGTDEWYLGTFYNGVPAYVGVVGGSAGTVVWNVVWSPAGSDPAPTTTPLAGGVLQVDYVNLGFPERTSAGMLTISATVDGEPTDAVEMSTLVENYNDFAWGPVP